MTSEIVEIIDGDDGDVSLSGGIMITRSYVGDADDDTDEDVNTSSEDEDEDEMGNNSEYQLVGTEEAFTEFMSAGQDPTITAAVPVEEETQES